MNRKLEKILVLTVDFIAINLVWTLFYLLRVESGLFSLFSEPEFLLPMFVVYLYWFFVFIFVGMYRTWFALSRFDELSTLFKTSFVAIFILFFVIFLDDYMHGEASNNRILIFIYWGVFFIIVSFGRLFVRSFQRNLLIKGFGRRNTLIVGFNPKAFDMLDRIERYRALGLDVKGFIAVYDENIGKEYKGIKVLDNYQNIEKAIDETDTREVIIALDKHHEDAMIGVIAKCDPKNVGLKIVPDLYEIISGQARTTHIYGFPLIDIMPELMPEWEKKVKRLMDISISLIILLISLPVTLIISVLIKLDSPGTVLYKQKRSGLNGKEFDIYKFRSMRNDAEKSTGPVWSQKNDPRITRVGKFIRKVRIDEIPQMINVLKGEMSLVGPRPERPFFVEKLSQEIPLYKKRLKVRPGVTGWAQVKHKYDETIEDVKTKLRYDLFYIENMSLRMDFKILFRTVFVVLFGKGHYE
ncbi:MAG: sugar transferase [Ignavibacteria bacterium]|nr:sugar transferase [Ignavibacteria bacterium]MCU7499591.1 sugar transferase [Ignavibacteria bacterium]MCU7513022.1 sugar transferase [Ignavibacteria bacterium]MCU7519293.1 sugar transferase [Ignavibacteria bacterium]MCU7525883.1 sugar transferase [Ignavibacteria bacterium]